MFLVSLSLPPQLDGGPAAAGDAHASIIEIHPADEPVGARHVDDAAANCFPLPVVLYPPPEQQQKNTRSHFIITRRSFCPRGDGGSGGL